MNKFKCWIYFLFVKHFGHQWRKYSFSHAAFVLEKLFGLAIFDYYGLKLLAGPVGYLDRAIICNENINSLVTDACVQHLKNGGVFLDIGANHGVLSLLAAKNPEVSVFAFEPSTRELKRLWKNLQLNPGNNINILSYGISDNEHKQDLLLASNDNPGRNSLPAILQEKGERVSCHFSRLTDLLSENILKQVRVCKIDVEGQELLVLNGMRECMHLLKSCVFVVEMTPSFLDKLNQSVEDIYQFFSEWGFKYQLGPQEDLFQWDEVFYQ